VRPAAGLCPEENLFVTASTGIAAVQIGGSTVHSFAGIFDGGAPVSALVAAVRRNGPACARWRDCRLLVVDETSMVSADLLEKLEALARAARGRPDGHVFGGIQLLLLGDFLQLPPVSPAQFAFESPVWDRLGLATVKLTRVFRQRDPAFVALLAELRVGHVGEETMRRLGARVGAVPPPHVVPTKLRGTNREVDEENTVAYRRLGSEKRDYPAQDEGTDARELAALRRNCPAPQTVSLRLGASVLLLKNVDVAAGLVNGSQGTVVAFEEDGPRVRFGGSASVTRVVRPMDWTVDVGGSVVARRRQVPLRLAYAITIHGRRRRPAHNGGRGTKK
jgi:ATP-dependent DNA helicase PIF1